MVRPICDALEEWYDNIDIGPGFFRRRHIQNKLAVAENVVAPDRAARAACTASCPGTSIQGGCQCRPLDLVVAEVFRNRWRIGYRKWQIELYLHVEAHAHRVRQVYDRARLTFEKKFKPPYGDP